MVLRRFQRIYVNTLSCYNVTLQIALDMKEVPQYLKEVQQYLKEVQRKSSGRNNSPSLQIHQGSCQYLSAKLTEAVEYSSQHFQNWTPRQNPKDFQHFIKKLYQLSTDIHDFVSECCKNEWIFVAVKLADPTEHLSLLVFELVLCTRLVASSNARGARHILSELSRRIDVHRAIKERVVVDKHKLLSKLEAHIASTHLTNCKEEKDVAMHLVHRLQSDAFQGPRLLDASTLQMWCVDHKSLKHREQIGKGASATVYKTRFLGGEFAEKIFFDVHKELFKNEVSILARLSHPHILPLLCCATSKNKCSLVLELMDTDLCHLMRGRMDNNRSLNVPFDLYEAVSIMLQIAEGMEYLHRNRIVHKDLKAENILVKCGKNGRKSKDTHQLWIALRKGKEAFDEEHVHVKVADFGLSKIKELSSTTSEQPVAGTTAWMAPELYSERSTLCRESSNDDKNYPFKADVYSFGMVCYEILTGRRPFYETQILNLLKEGVVKGDRPKLPQGTSPDLIFLIQKCWMFTPTDRPSFTEICGSLRYLHCSLMKGTFPNP